VRLIVVCEPQCKGLSHEKVNSGFLTALRLAYPDQPIVLYADPSHSDALKSVLANDGVRLSDIEYRSFPVVEGYSLRGIWAGYRALQSLFTEIAQLGVTKVFFLSFSPSILHVIKRLKMQRQFAAFRFSFVLHGDFENVAGPSTLAATTTTTVHEPLALKLRSIELRELPSRTIRFLRDQLKYHYDRNHQALFGRLLTTKAQLLWRHSADYKYIALSPHIIRNVAQYIDPIALNMCVVSMPINFAPVLPAPRNDKIIFATFGYGDVPALLTVADRLSKLTLKRDYEVRVIGLGHRAFAAYPKFVTLSHDRALTRAEMERHARDVDAFLILYDHNRYRLSCSGSILEALSYCKPVLHLPNDCIDEFDRPTAPIGFRCDNLSELAIKMKSLIDTYPDDTTELDQRRQNVLRLRERLAIPQLLKQLRDSFTFDD
jgi:hypothetical protein